MELSLTPEDIGYYELIRDDLKNQGRRILAAICEHLKVEWLSYGIENVASDENYVDGVLLWIPLKVQFDKPELVVFKPNLVGFEVFDLSKGFPTEWLYLERDEIKTRLSELEPV